MMVFHRIDTGQFLSLAKLVRRWRKANRNMGWSIPLDEFRRLESGLQSLPAKHGQDHSGLALCYGFGEVGDNGCDAVLSGKRAWQYAIRLRGFHTWQCQYIHLDQPEYVRLRPDAPARPKGFYFANIFLPAQPQTLTVAKFRKKLSTGRTGLGPEGIQMLCITHPHLAMQMNERLLPFIALADYDVAPYGYHDYFDAVQMFCSNSTICLGIGNIDRNYPLFGIPYMTTDFKEILPSVIDVD